MAEHIDTTYVRANGACEPTWIGFSDRTSEGNFIWADQSAPGYTNWWDGEPNNMDNEDCASLGVDCIYGFDGVGNQWVDSGCEPGNYEYHARAPPSPAPPPFGAPGGCFRAPHRVRDGAAAMAHGGGRKMTLN